MPASEATLKACRQAIRTSRCGETLAGMDLARDAFRLAQSESEPASSLEALNTIAICQAAHVAFIQAVATAIDAFELARKLEDRAAMAQALTTLAGAAGFILDTLDVTLAMLARCLDYALAANDVALEVRVRNIRGVMLGNLKRCDEADREFAIALIKVDQAGENTPRTLVMGNHAHVAVKRARDVADRERPAIWAEAEARIDAALTVAHRAANIDAESRIYYSLGELRLQQRRYEEAADAYNHSMRLLHRLKQRSRIIECWIDIARIRIGQQHLFEALSALHSAQREAEADRPTRQISRACTMLAEVYRQLGILDEAERHERLAQAEHADFQRESEQARRQLQSFWHAMEPTALQSTPPMRTAPA